MSEPKTLTAGDSWAWSRTVPGYNAATWSATYVFRNLTDKLELATTGDGETFTVAAAKAATADLAPGVWRWVLVMSDGTNRVSVDHGEVRIKPDPTAEGDYDPRTQAERALAAVQAVLAEAATHDQMSYSIQGRTLNRMSRAELLKHENALKWEVARERQRERLEKGLPSGTNVGVRFGRA